MKHLLSVVGLCVLLTQVPLFAQGAQVAILGTGMWPGEAANPAEPNANLSLGAIQYTLDAPNYNPRFAPEDSRAPKLNNPAVADYEYENFTSQGFTARGTSHTLRFARALYRENSSLDYGLRGVVQYLSIKSASMTGLGTTNYGFWNFAPGAYAEKNFVKSMDQLVTAGASLDLILYDGTFASKVMLDSRAGGQLSCYGRAAKWVGIHSFTGGALLQEVYAGNLTQTNLGLSAQWLANIQPSIVTKVEVLYKLILLQNISSIANVDPQNRSEMRLGLGGIYWFSNSFGTEIAYRATLLMTQLDMNTLVLQSKFAF